MPKGRYHRKLKRIRYLRRRALRSQAAKIRFKSYRRLRNRLEGRWSKTVRTTRRRHQGYTNKFVRVKAPEILSFIHDPEGVCLFISKLKECFDTKKPTFVVLNEVKRIDDDGILVLLSVMIRFKSHRIRFNGDFPEDLEARKVLEQSDFFVHLYRSKFAAKNSYTLTSKNSIVTHAMRNVDAELGEVLIEAASQTVWQEKRRCTGVQRTFIELMQNTNNHASLQKEGDKHWWLSIKHIPSENRVTFSFVDYGVGVFYNLRNKQQGNKFYKALDRLRELFSYGSDADILKLIFSGDLHKTASGKPFRGKGLPGIYEAFQKNKISNLAMITNDVFYNSANNEYRLLQNDFQGTFVSWELNQTNASLPYEPQNI